jgi:hypothetical protein
MLSQRLLGKLNEAANNPSASPIVIYDTDTQEGVCFDRRTNSMKCICPFCLGQNLVPMANHINIEIYGFIKNYSSDPGGPDYTGCKPSQAHGTDYAEFSATDSWDSPGL